MMLYPLDAWMSGQKSAMTSAMQSAFEVVKRSEAEEEDWDDSYSQSWRRSGAIFLIVLLGFMGVAILVAALSKCCKKPNTDEESNEANIPPPVAPAPTQSTARNLRAFRTWTQASEVFTVRRLSSESQTKTWPKMPRVFSWSRKESREADVEMHAPDQAHTAAGQVPTLEDRASTPYHFTRTAVTFRPLDEPERPSLRRETRSVAGFGSTITRSDDSSGNLGDVDTNEEAAPGLYRLSTLPLSSPLAMPEPTAQQDGRQIVTDDFGVPITPSTPPPVYERHHLDEIAHGVGSLNHSDRLPSYDWLLRAPRN
jgi:hypothetical protein